MASSPAWKLSLALFCVSGWAKRQLPASRFHLYLNQWSKSLSSTGFIHLRLHSGSIFTATSKAKQATITFFKTLHFIFVRRPWLLKLSKVGEPPVPIFNLLKQNINHTVFPFLEMSLKLRHYPVVVFGLLKKNFKVSHYSPVQPGQWGGFFPSGLQKLRFVFS